MPPRALEARLASLGQRDADQERLSLLRRYLLAEDLVSSRRVLDSINRQSLDAAGRWRLRLLSREFQIFSGQETAGDFDELVRALPSAALERDLTFSKLHTDIAMGRSAQVVDALVPLDTALASQDWRELLWKALTRHSSLSPPQNTSSAHEDFATKHALRDFTHSFLKAATLKAQQRMLDDSAQSLIARSFADAMPASLQLIQDWRQRPVRVGLVLPLSGPLSSVGDAFLEGFVTAWFAAAGDSQVSFRLYDSQQLVSEMDYERFAGELVGDRIALVIGPISRAKLMPVQRVLPSDVGWIALNQFDDAPNLDDGQFVMELSTEAEVRDLVRKIRARDSDRILVYYQSSGWSRRALDTLERELGGERFIGKVALLKAAAVTEDVGLSLLVDRSEARIRNLGRLLQDDVESRARRRQDVDTLVSLVDGDLSAALQPALRYHGAATVQLFGTSRMMRGLRPSDFPNFEGVRFFESPWNLADSSFKQRIHSQFGTASPAVENFRAIGLDCFRLADRFALLRELQQGAWIDSLQGASGLLWISGGLIHRSMVWTHVSAGRVEPVPGAP